MLIQGHGYFNPEIEYYYHHQYKKMMILMKMIPELRKEQYQEVRLKKIKHDN